LISVMKKHQRYFPVHQITPDGQGGLLPYFIFVANKPFRQVGEACEGEPVIVAGNQHVIRARFTDAAYFVREDMKKPLESFVPRLETLTFQIQLGSMLDKTRRIVQLTEILARGLKLESSEIETARRAAFLCKADLATSMVVEMTSLQGVMGRYYALNSGEPKEVAEAIYEHYLPRHAGDITPKTRPGLVVGLADRLDTLTGLFAAGLAPTGSKDPFAQRRAALGLVQNLIVSNIDFDLIAAINEAASLLPVSLHPEDQKACLEFIIERQRNLLLEQGERYDVVDAILAAQGNNPASASQGVKALSTWVARPDWNAILPAYARCVRITRDLTERQPLEADLLVEEAEKTLFAALLAAEKTPRKAGSVDDFLNAFQPMIPPIDRFFDLVLVMAEDHILRRNRLGLLQRIAALADGVADLSRLEGF
jgi:glycyl-tRNA synthetase